MVEINSVFVAIGGAFLGVLLVWTLSRGLSFFRPKRDHERVTRLEVRANTLRRHVRPDRPDRPYTAEEVGDAFFGEEYDDRDGGDS